MAAVAVPIAVAPVSVSPIAAPPVVVTPGARAAIGVTMVADVATEGVPAVIRRAILIAVPEGVGIDILMVMAVVVTMAGRRRRGNQRSRGRGQDKKFVHENAS